ncbi:hypothetical protein FNYG_01375 [Fusarium nygamai]|uniref:Uncharacterized protein n=1 Tax=Gibberella nygamai TaxID=42673 RepID=A0A2K0WSE3_GIBNY|nr:hypothetical protein FNYG_01375 [Fusarium nygamai]
MMAARRGFKRSLEVILARKDSPPDIDMEVTYYKGGENDENRGKTALRQAVDNGQYECASLLLEAGARLDEMLIDGKYLFQLEKEQNSAEGFTHFSKVVEQCVARSTKVGCPNEDGNTPLHRIHSRTPVPKIQLFVSMGSPIDCANSHGWTPLANAVKSGNLAAAKFLVSRGARADMTGPFGSLLHLSCQIDFQNKQHHSDAETSHPSKGRSQRSWA